MCSITHFVLVAGAEVHRVRGADGAAVHHQRVRGAGVRAVHAPLRLPRDPAHPGALHGRADGARAGRAARAHGPAHPGPVRQLRGAARAGARRRRRPRAPRGRRARQGAAAVAAQVRVQRGGEVRHARHAQRARAAHRRAVRLQRQRAARHDEGPVRQLRGAEDDRRGRAHAAQGAHAQDPPARGLAAQVHVRQAHHRQAGEVLHEGARAGPHRAAAAGRRALAAAGRPCTFVSMYTVRALASKCSSITPRSYESMYKYLNVSHSRVIYEFSSL